MGYPYQQENPYPVRDDISEEFHEAVLTATEMRMWIHNHTGPGREYFFSFFRPFSNLFELTCDIEPVKKRLDNGDDNIRKKIEEWFDTRPNLNDNKSLISHMKAGLVLFRSYKKILSEAQIIKEKR